MAVYMLDMHMMGSNLSVYADFWSRTKSKFISGLFTFDTGASVTTISKDILFDLGYDVISGKTHKITTASSIEFVREVTIDRIRLGECELDGITVYAHTFPEESLTTGVIGLNVLTQFDINMLFSKKLIELIKV